MAATTYVRTRVSSWFSSRMVYFKGGEWVKGTVLVAEPVLRPYARLAVLAVHRVNEAEASGFFRPGAIVRAVAEQPRWHARPCCEDHERDQVAHGHCPPPCLV